MMCVPGYVPAVVGLLQLLADLIIAQETVLARVGTLKGVFTWKNEPIFNNINDNVTLK